MDSEHLFRASDGVELAYWIRRCPRQPAPAILFLHGAASNHTRWSELSGKTSLIDSYDLIRPDMRGNARSMMRGRLDLEIWCRDLSDLLDDAGYPQAILVGHSLGAQIAAHFAAEYPTRARSLVLIDPVVRSALQGKRLWMARCEPLFWLAIWTLRFFNRLGLRRRHFPFCDLEQMDQATRKAMDEAQDREELVRRYSSLGPILEHMPLANYLQQLIATAAPLPPADKIEVPVLVLESTGVSFADREATRAVLRRLPRVEMQTIDATHWPLTERPEQIRRAIEAWIAQLDATT